MGRTSNGQLVALTRWALFVPHGPASGGGSSSGDGDAVISGAATILAVAACMLALPACFALFVPFASAIYEECGPLVRTEQWFRLVRGCGCY